MIRNILIILLTIPIALFVIIFCVEMIEGARLERNEQAACRMAATNQVEYWKC